MKSIFLARAGFGAALALALGAPSAEACLSCGCGGSGTSADLGAIGGASSLFSQGSRWLIQQAVSFRGISGSFNELGRWNPTPVDGSLQTLQGSLGLTYFPMSGTSIGVQLPAIANRLDKASWGPMGSVRPTDLAAATGYGLGDLSLQGTYKFHEGDGYALAAWSGLSLPTGNADGAPEALSGSGVSSGQLGLIGLAQWGDLEVSANLGYQRPFGRPQSLSTVFYIGEAWLYQLQGNWRVSDALRVGLGLNGYRGIGRFGENELPLEMGKLKLIPSLQYAFTRQYGMRLAVGADPGGFGVNNMTDTTAYAVFYQYIR